MIFKITSSLIIFSRNNFFLTSYGKRVAILHFSGGGGAVKTDMFSPFHSITSVHALKIWKHAYLDLSISDRTKIDLQRKVHKQKYFSERISYLEEILNIVCSHLETKGSEEAAISVGRGRSHLATLLQRLPSELAILHFWGGRLCYSLLQESASKSN